VSDLLTVIGCGFFLLYGPTDEIIVPFLVLGTNGDRRSELVVVVDFCSKPSVITCGGECVPTARDQILSFAVFLHLGVGPEVSVSGCAADRRRRVSASFPNQLWESVDCPKIVR